MATAQATTITIDDAGTLRRAAVNQLKLPAASGIQG